jgi:hypothetical protein
MPGKGRTSQAQRQLCQRRMDRSRMGRKFGSRWAARTSALRKGEAVSGLGSEKTVATAMVVGAVVAFAWTTKGAVPWWNAMSSRSTSGNTTISSMMNIKLVRMNTVDRPTFHRDIIRSVLPEFEAEVNPPVVPLCLSGVLDVLSTALSSKDIFKDLRLRTE